MCIEQLTTAKHSATRSAECWELHTALVMAILSNVMCVATALTYSFPSFCAFRPRLAFSEEQRQIDTAISIPRLELGTVASMPQVAVEQNGSVGRMWDCDRRHVCQGPPYRSLSNRMRFDRNLVPSAKF
jgi:hypothetical protein